MAQGRQEHQTLAGRPQDPPDAPAACKSGAQRSPCARLRAAREGPKQRAGRRFVRQRRASSVQKHVQRAHRGAAARRAAFHGTHVSKPEGLHFVNHLAPLDARKSGARAGERRGRDRSGRAPAGGRGRRSSRRRPPRPDPHQPQRRGPNRRRARRRVGPRQPAHPEPGHGMRAHNYAHAHPHDDAPYQLFCVAVLPLHRDVAIW